MNEIINEITGRGARRGLSEETIDRTVLERIFKAATLSPSCANKQPWRFMVCTADGSIEKAREALLGGNYWATKAPVLVGAMTSDDLDCKGTDSRNYAWFDTGMAVTHPIYGPGKIVALDGQGTNRKATVTFPAAGQKEFVLAHSPLRIAGRR